MPIYDYVCGSCGHRFEVFRGINEAGPHQCPECGGPVARAFVPPTIHFKGSGWAKTDRRATSAPTRRKDAGTPASGTSKSSSDDGSATSTETSAPSAGTDAQSAGSSVTAERPTASDADR